MHYVRLKLGIEGQTGDGQHQHRLYSGKGLWGRSPARDLEPTVTHRPGLDTGGSGKVPGRSLRDTIAGQPRRISYG
jgi:hypothetical protein